MSWKPQRATSKHHYHSLDDEKNRIDQGEGVFAPQHTYIYIYTYIRNAGAGITGDEVDARTDGTLCVFLARYPILSFLFLDFWIF